LTATATRTNDARARAGGGGAGGGALGVRRRRRAARPDASPPPKNEATTLCDALDRVLNKGVVATGEVVISVAGIDLVAIGVHVLLASIDTAHAIATESETNERNRMKGSAA